MGRPLTSLERVVMSNKIGRKRTEVLVIAVRPSDESGAEYFHIDRVIFCPGRTDKYQITKLKREMKAIFPEDKIRVVKTETWRTE